MLVSVKGLFHTYALIIHMLKAGLDGTLHIWSTSGTYARPSSTIENAHTKGTETGSVVFSHDCHTLLSRGGDGTVKCESIIYSPIY